MKSTDCMSTKEKIIKRSCYYYGLNGDNFSLSQVARDLDIKKQSIYSYYRSKDELLITVLNKLIDDYESQMLDEFDTFKDMPSKEQLYHIGLSFIKANSDTENVWIRKWLSITCRKNDAIREKVASSAYNFQHFFDQLFNDCINDGLIAKQSPDALSEVFIVILRGNVDNLVPFSLEKNIRTYDSMFNFFWNSIESSKE